MKITLVEIMVCIAIIAIVASFGFDGVRNYKADHAHDSKPALEFIK